MIVRTLEHWRALPHLRIRECAEIAGVGERTIEEHLAEMETRTIGRIRFVTTASFRRWLGERVAEEGPAEPVDPQANRWARRVVRGLS